MMKNILMLLIASAALNTTPTAHVSAQPANKKAALTIKHTDDFEVRGDGTDKAWSSADWFPLKKSKGSADYQTQAKLLYSNKGIYALFSCADKTITATLKEDFADLYKEDVIEIFFWTDESTRLYFEYELSPLNYELAILVPNFKGDFFGWRPWHYEGDRKTTHQTSVTKDDRGNITGWMGEVFIPYALLKPLVNVPPRSGTQWRINLYRIDYDLQHSSWTWQPVQGNFHDIDSFGTVEFQ
ncbi:MAG TPA: carbohydrate-binding family 9-like protein [Chryseolinea sp.]|nr:carbohydrate-binding family 9-like protein [Chryseolinea sp.]